MAADFPYKIETLPEEENEQIKTDFQGYLSGAVRVQPTGYFFQGIYRDYAHHYYNFGLRDTDVFVVSYPKCGTTWTQELVWLLIHDLDFEGAKVKLDDRFPFFERDCVLDCNVFHRPEICKKLNNPPPEPGDYLASMIAKPSPRTLKTHMPFSLLPPALLDICKVIYVVRDPRDVVVSYYHHHRMWITHGYKGDFKTFFNYFLNEQILWSPFWSHVEEAWELRNKCNLLILTYDELKGDLSACISKVASFLGKKVSPTDMARLMKHLHFDSMKRNPAINCEDDVLLGVLDPGEGGFVRKGKSGGWCEYFDHSMKDQFEKWMVQKGKGLEKEFKWLY